MPKPENPGGRGRDKDKNETRDIDKYLPPKRPWRAMTIPTVDNRSDEITFDPATQKLEILPHQFDAEGEQLARRLDVTVVETDTGAVLIVSYPALQALIKVVDKDEDDETVPL